MKKYLSILALLTMGLQLTTSCSSDDSNDTPVLPVAKETKSYVTIGNATYSEGTMPQATTTEATSAQVSSTVQAGGTSVIRVTKDRAYTKFYIAVKGMPGYWVYAPTTRTSRAEDDDDDFIDIPFNAGSSATGSVTIQISGETEDGEVTQPYEQTINITAGQRGALVRQISYGEMSLYSMQYDNLGRLTSLICQETDISISYGSVLTIKDNNEGLTYTASLNDMGYISSMKTGSQGFSASYSFSYDKQGHLLKITGQGKDYDEVFSGTWTQTWSDGNLTRCSVSSDEGTYNASFTYGNYVNQQHQFFYTVTPYDEITSGLYAAGLLGVTSDKLPIEVQQSGDEYGMEKATFSYTFNEDGTIKTQTQTQNGYSVVLTYSY